MRTVFSNNELVHVFAQRTHTHGRTQNGNLFFEGDKIYSYGYHYLLGEFVYNNINEIAVIINTDPYSRTTAKHSSLVAGATTQYLQFEKCYTYEESVISMLKELEIKLLRARKPLIYIEKANDIMYQYNRYLYFIYGRNGLPIASNRLEKAFAPFQVSDDKLKSLQNIDKARREKEEQRKNEKLKLEIEDFLNYEKKYIHNSGEEYLRIAKGGNLVETSKGVSVTVREAKILYNKILKGEDIKGVKIDHYTVIGLNGTLKIGCHNINLENMHNVGKQLINK